MRFLPSLCVCVGYQGIWKRCINIHAWIVCFDGLTDGVVFLVKHKESIITLRIMNAYQVSTMHTIINAFPVIRSKVEIECAQ